MSSAPKISLSLSTGRKPAPEPVHGVKRSRATALHEDDEDNDSATFGRAQKVSHFDQAAGGAIDEAAKKDDAPLVIAKQSNRDWRQAAQQRRRQTSRLPGQEENGQRAQQTQNAEQAQPTYGLNVFDRPVQPDAQSTADGPEEVTGAQTAAQNPESSSTARPRTEDEVALDALLGRTVQDATLVLPRQPATASETDVFRNDFTSAPPMASLDDYARVPVEQFGAALLRGMGWKDGEGIGSQRGKKILKPSSKPPERRAALLGIGAKEDAAIAQEFGAWGKAARGDKGVVKIYNPVLLKDKRTGELFTEEELQKKQEREQRERYEHEFDLKEKDRQRRRERESDRPSDRERAAERRRGDDRDYDRRGHEKERRRHRDSDDEGQRRKDRDRRRQDDRRREDGDDDRERRRDREWRHRHERDERDDRRSDRELPRHSNDRERDYDRRR